MEFEPFQILGYALADLEIRTKYGVHVIGVVQPGNEDRERKVTAAPSADTVLREGEALLLLGKIEYLERFSRRSQR